MTISQIILDKPLTDFPASHYCPLLRIESFLAGPRLKKLDETICLLDRHLGQLAVFVKDVEQISLRNSFSWKIACIEKIHKLDTCNSSSVAS